MIAFVFYLHILKPHINILFQISTATVSKKIANLSAVEHRLHGSQNQVKTDKVLQNILYPEITCIDNFKVSTPNLSF